MFNCSRGENPLMLSVAEEPAELLRLFEAGRPMELTETDGDEKVWVNPANVAYWEEEQPLDPTAYRIEVL